jgi:hypothetical protein
VDPGLLRAKLADGDSRLDVRGFLEELRSSPMGPFEELRRAALSTSFVKAVSALLEELGC